MHRHFVVYILDEFNFRANVSANECHNKCHNECQLWDIVVYHVKKVFLYNCLLYGDTRDCDFELYIITCCHNYTHTLFLDLKLPYNLWFNNWYYRSFSSLFIYVYIINCHYNEWLVNRSANDLSLITVITWLDLNVKNSVQLTYSLRNSNLICYYYTVFSLSYFSCGELRNKL